MAEELLLCERISSALAHTREMRWREKREAEMETIVGKEGGDKLGGKL